MSLENAFNSLRSVKTQFREPQKKKVVNSLQNEIPRNSSVAKIARRANFHGSTNTRGAAAGEERRIFASTI